MSSEVNRKVVLAQRPVGMPTLECFRVEEEPARDLEAGEVRVATEHISIDAFIRTTLNEESFHAPVPIGGTVSALGVGRVLESRANGFAPGDAVFAPVGAQTRPVLSSLFLEKIDEKRAPLTAYLGALGLTTGMTAYFGVLDVGRVRPGETFLVSAAAGAVGSIAGQIAKLAGARVVGLAGGPAKVEYLVGDLGFDAGIDYKGEDTAARLREVAPEGVDVYFDNVGGELLDVVLDQIREQARVVICGAISQYQNMGEVRGPSLYLRLAERHARMEGFAVNHFETRYAEARARLGQWPDGGQIRMKEHVEVGIEQFPTALLMLFDGSHTGKLLVEV